MRDGEVTVGSLNEGWGVFKVSMKYYWVMIGSINLKIQKGDFVWTPSARFIPVFEKHATRKYIERTKKT